MPLTPFDLGPAVVLKAVWPGWFSLGVFTAVQVAIDVETVSHIATGQYPLHGPWHTVPGSVLVGAVILVPARYGLAPVSAFLRRVLAPAPGIPRRVIDELAPVSWPGAALGALLGALSHVALDAFMHPDVTPLAPWRGGNPLFVPDSSFWLHAGCLVVGLLGLLAWPALASRRQART